MLLKKYYLYAFIFICLLLAVILYYTDRPVNFFVVGDDSSEPGPVDNRSADEGFDYYTLVYSKEKDSAVEIGDKADYFAEPEPEQEQEQEPEPETAAQPRPSGVSTSNSQKEQQMFSFINEARRNAGLPALQLSAQLTTAARAKSKDISGLSVISHTSPTYGDLTGLLRSFGISYRSAGENLAMNSSGNVNDANNMLMNSSGHRSNILGSGFTMVGVGIYVKSDGSHYYTQLFVGY